MDMLTNDSRGLKFRGLDQDKSTKRPSSEQNVKNEINLTSAIRAKAEKVIKEREDNNVNSGWQVWSLDTSYYVPDGAQSFEEVSVTARTTCKRLKEKPFPEINYSSGTNTYSLAELRDGPSSRTKRPVATTQMLDKRTDLLDAKEKKKLSELATKLKDGKQEDVGEEMQEMTEERLWNAKNRVAQLDKNSTDKDFSNAISEVSKAMLLSDSPKAEKLIKQIEQKHSRKVEQSKERFKWMGGTASFKKRLITVLADQQKMGGHNPEALKLVTGEQQPGKEPIDREMAIKYVNNMAEANKPTGHKLLSVEANFHWLVSLGWMVEVTVIYEAINPRGLPVPVNNAFQISLKDLLSPDIIRQPIVPNQLHG